MSPVYSFSDFRIPRASPAFVGIRKKVFQVDESQKAISVGLGNPEMQGLAKKL